PAGRGGQPPGRSGRRRVGQSGGEPLALQGGDSLTSPTQSSQDAGAGESVLKTERGTARRGGRAWGWRAIMAGNPTDQQVTAALEAGEGILRLAPTWVPRSFLVPGRRLKLASQDLYALGAHRGGIDERWFGSTIVAA